MKRLVILLLILGLAVWLGLGIAKDPGYLLMAYQQWTVEMPLWLGFIFVSTFFLLLQVVVRVLWGVLHIQHRWHHMQQRRANKRIAKQNELRAAWLEAEQQKDMERLLVLEPEIRRWKVGSELEREQLQVALQKYPLETYAARGTMSDVGAYWRERPRRWRQHDEIILAYVKALRQAGQDTQAQSLIEKMLSRNWDPRFVNEYGRLKHADTAKLFRRAEAWAKIHETDADLLAALGRLSLSLQLWGQARRYLSASLSFTPNPEVYYELGKLLEQLNEPKEALQCYQRGLECAVLRSSP